MAEIIVNTQPVSQEIIEKTKSKTMSIYSNKVTKGKWVNVLINDEMYKKIVNIKLDENIKIKDFVVYCIEKELKKRNL